MGSAILRVISTAAAVCLIMVARTDAHGRLVEPPSRSSMWRFGFATPKNYDDNQLSCGGYNTQWGMNGGRCGVCGDPYNGRRENEAGGKYATGTLARHYTEGQTIPVTLDITKNHGGWFEFRICPNNDPTRPATESCLNQKLLAQPNGQTRWQLPSASNGKYSYNLVLPRGLTCSQCVLQWKWNTASNWGCDATGCGKGHGTQEHFMGCADVAISSSSSSSASSSSSSSSSHSSFGIQGSSAFQPAIGSHIGAPVAPSGGNQNSGSGYQGSSAFHPAIGANIGAPVASSGGDQNSAGFQPIGSFTNPGTSDHCEATVVWKAKFIFADQWCKTQCAVGNCPTQYCQNGCRLLHG